jgi:hypothetical protein
MAGVKRFNKPISKELLEFIRGEQMKRLKNALKLSG